MSAPPPADPGDPAFLSKTRVLGLVNEFSRVARGLVARLAAHQFTRQHQVRPRAHVEQLTATSARDTAGVFEVWWDLEP